MKKFIFLSALLDNPFKPSLKNSIIYISLLFICFSVTGCLNIIEEIWINEDQSGRYTYTLDMSETLKSTQNIAKGINENIQLGNSDADSYQDTTIFLTTMPDSIKQQFQNPAILEHLQVRFLKDLPNQIIQTTYILEFKNVSEISELWTMMPKLSAAQPKSFSQGGAKNQGSLIGIPPIYSFQKDTFIRVNMPMSASEKTSKEALQKQASNPIFASMFENAQHKIIVHLPKSVKKTEGVDVAQKGKVVETSVFLLDLGKDIEKLNFRVKIE